MTIETKFNIGQPVWHCDGVYEIHVQEIIFAIKAQYNEVGVIEIYYSFPDRIKWNGWLREGELFASEQELVDFKNTNTL